MHHSLQLTFSYPATNQEGCSLTQPNLTSEFGPLPMIHFAEEWQHRKKASALQDTLYDGMIMIQTNTKQYMKCIQSYGVKFMHVPSFSSLTAGI